MKFVLFANTEWYLYNFRRGLALALALALRDAGHDVLLVSPPGPYGERLQALGLRWQPLPMDRRSLNPLRELALLWYLFRLFRHEKPTLVHGFTIKCAAHGSLIACLAGMEPSLICGRAHNGSRSPYSGSPYKYRSPSQ